MDRFASVTHCGCSFCKSQAVHSKRLTSSVLNATVCRQVAYYILIARERGQLSNIKGPPSSWIFGNLLQVSDCCCKSEDMGHLCAASHHFDSCALQISKDFTSHLQLEEWYHQYGPVFKIYLGRAPVVVITGTNGMACLCSQLQQSHFASDMHSQTPNRAWLGFLQIQTS